MKTYTSKKLSWEQITDLEKKAKRLNFKLSIKIATKRFTKIAYGVVCTKCKTSVKYNYMKNKININPYTANDEISRPEI